MQGSASGPLGVLLMIAPLAAIPVFAIVGVPQFAPVAASPSDDDDLGDAVPATMPLAAAGSPAAQTNRGSADDLFARVPEVPPAGRGDSSPGVHGSSQSNLEGSSGRQQPPGKWLPPPDSLDHWEVVPSPPKVSPGSGDQRNGSPRGVLPKDSERPGVPRTQPADDSVGESDTFNPDLLKPDNLKRARTGRSALPENFKSVPDDTTAGGPRGANQLAPEAGALAQLSEQSGWQEASRRLKQLGIRKYRLVSQIDQQNFVFACNFASPTNPQVVRRFEADADNPLEAVQKVLTQIDEWRSRSGGQGAPRGSEDQ